MSKLIEDALECTSFERIIIPEKLSERFYSFANCDHCGYPLYKIEFKMLSMAVCLNCGWLNINNPKGYPSIGRSVKTVKKVYK